MENPVLSSDALRQRILASATKLFMVRGFQETSIEEIARDAATTKRSLYSRYASKMKLFEDVVHNVLKTISPRDFVRPRSDGVEQRLTELGHYIVRLCFQPSSRDCFRIMLAESWKFPEIANLWFRLTVTLRDVVQKVLDVAVRYGELCPGNNKVRAGQFLALVATEPMRLALSSEFRLVFTSEHERHVQQCVELFLHGCSSHSRKLK
ncbi:TetR/AcrR family transcriptional regulator [Aureimonas fodinaquatilis]|uniref:TetR/AcrR family transcriptional regulator n=1 Tax=Aureimonas fodinaquatilis TaxID=2565783 RepID=A0A5B0DVZ1_9HYPH|nr:TetR/AcrR family transcriptional regulator [Aureimonas fodinaquatilis]KAA0970182.1 TetR/AcrR family transcriptional regulator [Aureimonas fodinaquatilis]